MASVGPSVGRLMIESALQYDCLCVYVNEQRVREGMDGGCMPMQTCQHQYCDPALLVRSVTAFSQGVICPPFCCKFLTHDFTDLSPY